MGILVTLPLSSTYLILRAEMKGHSTLTHSILRCQKHEKTTPLESWKKQVVLAEKGETEITAITFHLFRSSSLQLKLFSPDSMLLGHFNSSITSPQC